MFSHSPAEEYQYGRAMAAAVAVATAAVEVAAPLPAVGVAAAASAPAVVAAPRVRVPGLGVVCVFQLLPRCFQFWMKTRAPSADGANLGHHAEPILREDLCAGTVGVGGAISARCG